MSTLFLGVCKLAREREEGFPKMGRLQNARESGEPLGLSNSDGANKLLTQIRMKSVITVC